MWSIKWLDLGYQEPTTCYEARYVVGLGLKTPVVRPLRNKELLMI